MSEIPKFEDFLLNHEAEVLAAFEVNYVAGVKRLGTLREEFDSLKQEEEHKQAITDFGGKLLIFLLCLVVVLIVLGGLWAFGKWVYDLNTQDYKRLKVEASALGLKDVNNTLEYKIEGQTFRYSGNEDRFYGSYENSPVLNFRSPEAFDGTLVVELYDFNLNRIPYPELLLQKPVGPYNYRIDVSQLEAQTKWFKINLIKDRKPIAIGSTRKPEFILRDGEIVGVQW